MKKKVVWLMLLVACAGLFNLGTIRRKKNAILETQAAGIAYQEKMEEIKDGVKGAPTPSFQFQKKAQFLTETPMETYMDSAEKPEEEAVQAEAAGSENEIWDEDQEGAFEPEEGQSEEESEGVEEEDWWSEDSEEEPPKN